MSFGASGLAIGGFGRWQSEKYYGMEMPGVVRYYCGRRVMLEFDDFDDRYVL